MKPFSMLGKRVLVAASLVLLTACGSNGITDPTEAKKSGYLTVSAAVSSSKPTTTSSGYNVPAVARPASNNPVPGNGNVTSSGYNVPAN